MRNLILPKDDLLDFDRMISLGWYKTLVPSKWNHHTFRGLIDHGDFLAAEIDVPGFTEKDLKVELDGRNICVSGQVKTRNVYKLFTIPFNPTESITAKLTNGVLVVSVQKPVTMKPRQIQIEVASNT